MSLIAAASFSTPILAQEALPDLDELLGLEEAPAEKQDEQDASATRRALDRAMDAEAGQDDFVQAVGLMGETAGRLVDLSDPGEATQRLQAEVLRKLDKVIEQAKQQQSSSSSSSSSSSQQQQQSQQPNQQNQSQQGSSTDGDNQSEQQPSGSGEARPASSVAADRAEWGALPERVREALRQGSSGRFSAVYRRMTESYYRRLAEEATR